jgi:hypothetical protein
MTDNAQQGNNMSSSAQGAPKPTGNKPQGTEAVRGAGSGKDANTTRERNLVDWPPPVKSHGDHVDELLEQAQDNEDYNRDVNEEQTRLTKEIRDRIGHPQGDPLNDEEERERVKQQFIDENDPAKKKERLKGEMDARAKRDKAQAEHMYATK